ncbi:MAG: cyclodeaminase/cyclohydrolase family protein [Gaiellaceae bacterium]
MARPFLELTVSEWLETLAAPEPGAASGSAAAMTAATAAAVIALTARATQAGGGGIAAQALALRGRLVGLAEWNAEVYAVSVAALADASGGGDERRDFELRTVLDRAAEVPLAIAEAAADVALLAAAAAPIVTPAVEPDALAAAALAAGAAAAAARLVEVNLGAAPGDERTRRARAAASRAAEAARGSLPGDSLQSSR